MSVARRLAALAAVGALLGCATEPEQAARPTLDAAMARLPAEAAGFRRASVAEVAPGEPGAGRVAEYATPGRVAVAYVFLYDMGRASVTAADLPPEMERSVQEGTALPSDRTGRSLNEQRRLSVAARGGPLSCAVLGGTFGRNPVERHVCVGTAAGRFLRVQVTMPVRSVPAADAAAFVAAVAGAARGG